MAVRIRFHNQAFEELRRGDAVQDELAKHAEEWAQAARDDSGRLGYQARRGVGESRDRAAVVTINAAAMNNEAHHHTLIRTMPGGT